MKIVTIKHQGTLQVFWKDCYQHPDTQTVANVKQGDVVAVMGNVEFQRLHQKGIL